MISDTNANTTAPVESETKGTDAAEEETLNTTASTAGDGTTNATATDQVDNTTSTVPANATEETTEDPPQNGNTTTDPVQNTTNPAETTLEQCPEGETRNGNSTGTCVPSCAAGYFSSSVNGTQNCFVCDPGCLTCDGQASFCTSCSTSEETEALFFHNNTCVANCPAGHTDVEASCYPCEGGCATCAYSTSKCTSCDGSYYRLYHFND